MLAKKVSPLLAFSSKTRRETMRQKLSKKQTLIIVILVAIAVNAFFFCMAYPQTSKPESLHYARDFSAYYIGEWRLIHNPTKIYAVDPQLGDYPILPKPQIFKYAPSFLILLSPSLTLPYQDALIAFDLLQLALVPILAFFVYKIVRDKNLILGSVAAIIILIEPLPTPAINLPPPQLFHFWLFTLNPQSFTPGYYCAYLFANAHILQTVLVVGALYFGFSRKPFPSAMLFALSSFDPRAALLALPLLLWYNRQEIRRFIAVSITFVLATNLPFFFYYNIGYIFLSKEVNGNVISQLYAYDWIPLYSVAILTIIEAIPYVRIKVSSLHQETPVFNDAYKARPAVVCTEIVTNRD